LSVAAAKPGRARAQAEEQRPALPYCIVDTGQKHVFDDRGQLFKASQPGEPFFGQDGFYRGNPPSYRPSSDGLTVYDNRTGLTWQRGPNARGDRPRTRDKLTWAQAQRRPAALNAAGYGGYGDWRLPSIKELYSLIDFRGTDPSGYSGTDTSGLTPFIDTRYFKFAYGETTAGERIIDSQYASSTLYVGNTRWGSGKLFGVNFADGRIKGYGLTMPGRRDKTFYVQCVRGNPSYGQNDFLDNGDGTISDRATGLMWSRQDSRKGMNWRDALVWVQARNRENHRGHDDWRLPSAKQLQSIVDYSRSPDTTSSAAIDPIFACTQITNEAGQADYPCYWTGTTHGAAGGRAAVYVAFGRAMGYMGEWLDVHGAGAQRSDPKAGDPANFPQGRGPQGDAIRIYNYVRLVRNIDPRSVRLVGPDLTPLPVLRMPGGPGGSGGPGGPEGGFHLLPRFARERMNLTADQERQIAELETQTKAQLDKILTPRQTKILDAARPPFPGGPGGGPGFGGPGDRRPPFADVPPPAEDGPPRREGPGGLGGPGGGFHLIPPFAVEKLNLTEDQQEPIAELEKQTKARLYKILTPQQQKILEKARPPRPGARGRRGPGGDPGRGGPDEAGPGGPARAPRFGVAGKAGTVSGPLGCPPPPARSHLVVSSIFPKSTGLPGSALKWNLEFLALA
jgi:hypothetical protein